MAHFTFLRKMGLFFKLALMILALLIISIGVTTVVSIREQTKIIKSELIKKNKTISMHLASSAKSAFWSLNWLFVEKQMREVTSSEDVLFLEIAKPDGEIYLASGDKEYMNNIPASELMSRESQIVKDVMHSNTDEMIKLIITPIEVGNERWSLIMLLSLKQSEEAKKTILEKNIWWGSIIFFLGMVVSFLFVQGIAKRISHLAQGTKEVAKGNLDFRIKEKSGDEIGDLASSFNKMTEDLKKTTTSRDLLAKEVIERKQAEEALKESEEKYRTILESIEEAYFEVDMAGNFAFFNDSLCRILGYPKDELMGMNNREYTDRETAKEIYQVFNTVYNTGKPSKGFLYEIIRKDGTKRHVETSVSLIWDEKGNKVGFRGILRDVTERTRAEEQRQSLEAQLQRARKMEAIGTLAGGVAHDLNNILSGIISYPELILLDLPKDSPLRDPVFTIQKSGEKAAAIVQDLLTLARRGVATNEVVNLNDIITEYLQSPVCKSLKSFHFNVKIETHLDGTIMNVFGSPVHLSKTVMNLVSNAAEAMPEGGTVLISTEIRYIDRPIHGYDEIEEGEYVTLTVSDTGVGMSAKEMERIFEPFYTKKVMGRSGTGLGMSVVWGTVKDHNGYIDVKSAEAKARPPRLADSHGGQGTTFTLYFPATRKDLEKEQSPRSMQEYMGRGESILVVDDVREQREIASRMLEKLGYAVSSVSSGEEAVEYLHRNSPNLLVLDMIMDPGIDGLETYRRALRFNPRQKAIIVSGFSETDQVKEAQKMGAGAYIKKPYSLEKIGVAIRGELDR
jgi:two-component system cell cycle sensor histidine kinase/response regulator CckA